MARNDYRTEAYWKGLKKRRKKERAAARKIARASKQDRKAIPEYRTMPYRAYLKTRFWARKREQTLKRDNYCCTNCHARRGDKNIKLHVHHKTYERRGNELLEDLTTLCNFCHRLLHADACEDAADNFDIIHRRKVDV